MSTLTDTLAALVAASVSDTDTTREDWQRALDQVFGKSVTADSPDELDPNEPRETTWVVTWAIDEDTANTAAQAASTIWRQSFGRGHRQPSNEECCIFKVHDSQTHSQVTIDLSEPQFAHLFD